MPPSYTSRKTHQLERTFLAGDLIVGVGYGAQIVLYVSCVLYLWSRRNKRLSVLLLAYLTVLFLLETAFTAVQAYSTQEVLVDNKNYPGGSWQYFLDTQHEPINIAFYALLLPMTFLADLLVVWRCWVTWSASGVWIAGTVTFFPTIVLVCSFVMGVCWIIQSSLPGQSLYNGLSVAYGTSYFALSIGANISLTVLIVTRLLLYQRRMHTALPSEHGKQCISFMTICIESAALYSVCGIVFLITYAIDDPMNLVFLGVTSASQQIAGYLIIYRLSTTTNTYRYTMSSTLGFKSHSGNRSCSQRMSFNSSSKDSARPRCNTPLRHN
ncbi:hypothetical protein VKT23_015964 [Stygiomarasmius scandens]|uniref:Uncharacterized protein n=1 Tax=Marasmiellus scandens TaxID=2682957 RepID=A0ABR1J0F9_9AGAR